MTSWIFLFLIFVDVSTVLSNLTVNISQSQSSFSELMNTEFSVDLNNTVETEAITSTVDTIVNKISEYTNDSDSETFNANLKNLTPGIGTENDLTSESLLVPESWSSDTSNEQISVLNSDAPSIISDSTSPTIFTSLSSSNYSIEEVSLDITSVSSSRIVNLSTQDGTYGNDTTYTTALDELINKTNSSISEEITPYENTINSTDENTTDSTDENTTDSTDENTTDSTDENTTDSTDENTTDSTDENTTDGATPYENTTDLYSTDTTIIDGSVSESTQTNPETTSEKSSQGSTHEGVTVGLVIGLVLTVLFFGVGVALWRAHRTGTRLWPPKHLFSNGQVTTVRPQPVPMKKVLPHCNEMLDFPAKLSHEYQLLASLSVDVYSTESFVAGQQPDNKCKNRYVNILPFDSTRVKLIPEENEEFYSDYINASYVKGYSNEIEYIATQGPKEETCRDFWRMVYQEPIKVIVMVTQLEEMGKPKCCKYFPNLRENLELEDLTIRCTTELHFPIYTSRTFVLTKGEKKRSITHLHFREWPDFGCPASPELMLQFCQVMRHNIILAQPGITLVHCSAGVGRTGTLIAVDILLQNIKENKKIDIFGTVYKLRKHRMNMVQSETQYIYLYKCVKEALEDPSYLSSGKISRASVKLDYKLEKGSDFLLESVLEKQTLLTSKENSSSSSLEPVYENVECAHLSSSASRITSDSLSYETECAL